MQVSIDWRIFMVTGSADKCRRVIDKIKRSTNFEFENIVIEPYWKEDGIFLVVAHTYKNASSLSEALGEVLAGMVRLSTAWTIAGPIQSDQEWEFNGSANQESVLIHGIKAIDFNMLAIVTEST